LDISPEIGKSAENPVRMLTHGGSLYYEPPCVSMRTDGTHSRHGQPPPHENNDPRSSPMSLEPPVIRAIQLSRRKGDFIPVMVVSPLGKYGFQEEKPFPHHHVPEVLSPFFDWPNCRDFALKSSSGAVMLA
jgi:hypothetical protein